MKSITEGNFIFQATLAIVLAITLNNILLSMHIAPWFALVIITVALVGTFWAVNTGNKSDAQVARENIK